MAQNEIMVMTEEQIAKAQAKAIDRFAKASAKAEKAGWELAKVVYETVNADNFKEVFGNLGNYSKALNFSKASLSKMNKAYERKLYMIGQDIETENYTLTQIEEITAVSEDDTLDFIEIKEVSDEDTCREIRDKAKAYNNPVTEEAEDTEDTEDTDESTEDTEDTEEATEEAKDIHIILSVATGNYCIHSITYEDKKYITASQLERIMAIINEGV